jgi:hypothetical protein
MQREGLKIPCSQNSLASALFFLPLLLTLVTSSLIVLHESCLQVMKTHIDPLLDPSPRKEEKAL